MAGRSGGSRSGGGRSGGSRSAGRSSFSSSRTSSGRSSYSSSRSTFSSGRSSIGSSSNRGSHWSRSGSSGSFSHTRPNNSQRVTRSGSRPSGSFTSYHPDYNRPTVMRQRPGIPTGSYTHTRPIGGSVFGGPIFGGGVFSGDTVPGGGVFSGGTVSSGGAGLGGSAASENDTCKTQSTTENGQTSSGMQNNRADDTTKQKGCLTSFLTVAVWVILIAVIFGLVSGAFSDGASGITKSTVARDKLRLGLSDEAGYYTDTCGWIDNRTIMEQGLREFYGETGILPYVYIIDQVDGNYDPDTVTLEAFAAETYEGLFTDQGHALLVFWDYEGAYEYVLWLGRDAAELMDTEACDILFDYLDYYYYEDMSDEEFFASAFSDTAKRIMKVSPTPARTYTLVIGVVVVAGAIYLLYTQRQKRKAKEAARKKRAEEILNAPLEKFGKDGDIIDELEKKYEKEI